MALVPACGLDAAGRASDTRALEDRASALDACSTVATAGGPWWNEGFPEQARRFHVEFDATPSTVGLDAVVGLAGGPAGRFTDLAAIVRFNASGTIDVRDGDTYRAISNMPYTAGQTFHIRIDLDVRTHRYSVFVLQFSYTAIARDYAFRTEQAGATALGDIASEVDGASGSIAVCNVTVVADHTTADGCLVASSGDGFVTTPVSDATVVGTMRFQATPSDVGIDGVIGLSSGAPAVFSDLAAAMRFSPTGTVDVRDGDTYRSDGTRYSARPYDLRITSDLTSHTYSVFQGSSIALELARQYRFRPTQAASTHLDHLSIVVDGPVGSVTLCSVVSEASSGVAYSREGDYSIAALPDGSSVISDGATTQRLDLAGHTVAQVADGGEVAVDAAGNVFVTSIVTTSSDTTVSVRKYAPGFALQWTTAAIVPAGSQIQAVGTDPLANVLVAALAPNDGSDRNVTVSRFASGLGQLTAQLSAPGNAVGLDGGQALVASQVGGTQQISRYDVERGVQWSRSFRGRASIRTITADPQHDVLFGGELIDPIDFGGGTLPLRSNPDGAVNGFFVLLSPDGDHLRSQTVGLSQVNGLAASIDNIAVSGVLRTQLPHLMLKQFGSGARPLSTGLGDGGLNAEELGVGGRVVIGPSGRLWWSLHSNFFVLTGFPYLLVTQ